MVSNPGERDRAALLPEAASVEERLRRLEAVTDVTLSRLDVDTLLHELLDRVRELLTTDTAAILLAG